jgi:hypothetical protein
MYGAWGRSPASAQVRRHLSGFPTAQPTILLARLAYRDNYSFAGGTLQTYLLSRRGFTE